jgi:hypothetical protein
MLWTCTTLLGFPDARYLHTPLAVLGECVPKLGNFIYQVTQHAVACTTVCDTSYPP